MNTSTNTTRLSSHPSDKIDCHRTDLITRFIQRQLSIARFAAATQSQNDDATPLVLEERHREEIMDTLSIGLADIAYDICADDSTSEAVLRAKALVAMEYSDERRDDLAQRAAWSLAKAVIKYLDQVSSKDHRLTAHGSVAPGGYPGEHSSI